MDHYLNHILSALGLIPVIVLPTGPMVAGYLVFCSFLAYKEHQMSSVAKDATAKTRNTLQEALMSDCAVALKEANLATAAVTEEAATLRKELKQLKVDMFNRQGSR